MKESKLKVAVISCGMIANAAHIPAYRSLGDKVDLAAVCDVNPVSAEQTAQRFQIPRWYTDAEEMLIKEKPDLVSVCTPNALHKKMAMLALYHGAHVACEKPIAFTYADAKEMFDYAKRWTVCSSPARWCATTRSTRWPGSSWRTDCWGISIIRRSP